MSVDKDAFDDDIEWTEAMLNKSEDFDLQGRDEQLRRIPFLLDIMAKIVANKCDNVLRLDLMRSATNFTEHKTLFNIIAKTLAHINNIQLLHPDYVRWLMGKLLRSLTWPVVAEKMFNGIQGTIVTISKFLDETELHKFLADFSGQIYAISQGGASILRVHSSSAAPELQLSIEVNDLTGSRLIVVSAIVSLFVNRSFKFPTLHFRRQIELWQTLFWLCRQTRADSQHNALQVMNLLLLSNLATEEMLRIAVDYLMALQTLGIQKKLAEPVKESIETVLKTLALQLREVPDSTLLKDVEAEVIIDWGKASLQLLLSAKSEGLFAFCTECLLLLSQLEVTSESAHSPKLLSLVQPLRVMLESCIREDRKKKAEERISAFLGVLLLIDEVSGSKEQTEWVAEMSSSLLSSFTSCGQVEQALRTRQLLLSASALALPPPSDASDSPVSPSQIPSHSAEKLLEKLLPTQEQLFEAVSHASSLSPQEGERVLLAVVALAAELVRIPHAPTPIIVAVLSLPWLTLAEMQIESKRHFAALPLLKDILKLAKQCKECITDSVRESTLRPLAHLHRSASSEWRRIIFSLALTRRTDQEEQQNGDGRVPPSCRLVLRALEVLATFIASVEPASYRNLIEKVLDLVDVTTLEKSRVDAYSVLTAISHSLCALDPSTRISSAGLDCEACALLIRDGTPSPNVEVELPPVLSQLLIRLLTDIDHRSELRRRCEGLGVLFGLLCHIPEAASRFAEVFKASLSLITDPDAVIRNEYECTFKVLVASSPSEPLKHAIKEALSKIPPKEGENQMIEFTAPFLMTLAMCCPDEELVRWAHCQLAGNTLRQAASDSLRRNTRRLIRARAEKDNEVEGDVWRFFARNSRSFSEVVRGALVDAAHDAAEDPLQTEQNVQVILECARDIFHFDSVKRFLLGCAHHLVSTLMHSADADRKYVIPILECICKNLNYSRLRELIEEYIPAIMETSLSRSHRKTLLFIINDHLKMHNSELFLKRRSSCVFYILRSFALNPSRALFCLETINSGLYEKPCTLTSMLKIRCEYLGLLLMLRRALQDDETFESRPTILLSLNAIIKELDAQFLDENAPKFMMVLRVATQLGEGSIEAWSSFVKKLSTEVLVSVLPQLLITIKPLFRFQSSELLLNTIFKERGQLPIVQSSGFERARMILLDAEDDDSERLEPFLREQAEGEADEDAVIIGCARMLMDEGDSVGAVVLRRLLRLLSNQPLRDDIASLLIQALLHTIRSSSDPTVRQQAASCLGKVGAVDPGRIGLSRDELRERTKGSGGVAGWRGRDDVFITTPDNTFYVDLLERCWRVYANLTDADMIDVASYAIQSLLAKLVGSIDSDRIFDRLCAECRRDIAPLKSTSLTHTKPLTSKPFLGSMVESVDSFPEWLLQCFLFGANKVRQHPLCDVFKALSFLVYTRDTQFARFVIPHLIVAMLIEANNDSIHFYTKELVAVLSQWLAPLASSGSWVGHAVHVVFSCIDVLERFVVHRLERRVEGDKELERTRELLKRICTSKTSDGSALLVVAAAEKSQCILRALRWCEQYGVSDSNDFDHQPFYSLQRLYMQVNDVDGVGGAYESIAKREQTTADEKILALEANGDYTDAIPLYSLSNENKELKLIKALLRLNQPQLAFNTVTATLKTMSGENGEDSLSRSLEAAQLEAAWQLKRWGTLEELVKKRDPLSELKNVDMGWGASCASLMSCLNGRDRLMLQRKVERARSSIVDRLSALAIDTSEMYPQAYKYITQLHILAEVEMANEMLLSRRTITEHTISTTLSRWEDRSEAAAQSASVLEPILRVRRDLLQAACPEGMCRSPVCQLLLQSCRLARQAGHLQIAWAFLVEAKALDTNHEKVGMEEARFEFQKGNHSEAIGLLSRLLSSRFSAINDAFNLFSRALATRSTSQPRRSVIPLARSNSFSLFYSGTRAERAAFAEVQLLRTEYMLKAGAVPSKDLYQTYYALNKMDVPSEDLHYRVAVFCDSQLSMEEIRPDLVATIIKTYADVLKYGRSHLYHAMPRLLAIWLDVSKRKHELIVEEKAKELLHSSSFKSDEKATKGLQSATIGASAKKDKATKERLNSSIVQSAEKELEAMINEIQRARRELSPYTFYTAFPQLVSRIEHPHDKTAKELEDLLGSLIRSYPHQCLWQSISVYRGDQSSGKLRKERMKNAYQAASSSDNSLGDLVDQYDYIAFRLMEVAVKNASNKTKVSEFCPGLVDFFKKGEMNTAKLVDADKKRMAGLRSVKDRRVMLPLSEHLENAVHDMDDVKVSYQSQFNLRSETMREESVEETGRKGERVFIHGIKEEFLSLRSMMAPKRLSLIGTDGRIYNIMCKRDDELRKDARLVDFCRMMNNLMRRCPNTRRRQLMVRTFTVIPLQTKGGILEWVDNLKTFKCTLQPLFEEKVGKTPDIDVQRNFENNWTVPKKVERMRNFYYKRFPLVMAEWFRRSFPDACGWHDARILFTRSSAVMSMIGFILGLGDRHGENLLIDLSDGSVMHVDFNCLFDKGETLPIPEVVPFRLTRNMVDGFGPTGVEGAFRKAAEASLDLMRQNSDTLLSVLASFIHDPLVEFSDRNRGQQRKQGAASVNSEVVAEPLGTANARETVEMVARRLRGHIVTPKTLSKQSVNAPPMGLQGQVSKLIEIATDEETLAQMFSGWAPYI